MFGQSECSILTYLCSLKTFLVIRDLCLWWALIDLSSGCLWHIGHITPAVVISDQTHVSASGLIRPMTISISRESLSPNIGSVITYQKVLSVSHGCKSDRSGPNTPKYENCYGWKHQNRKLTQNVKTKMLMTSCGHLSFTNKLGSGQGHHSPFIPISSTFCILSRGH